MLFCFDEIGIIGFLPANRPQSVQPPFEYIDGQTCTHIDEAGKLVLYPLTTETLDEFIDIDQLSALLAKILLVEPSAFVIDLITLHGLAATLKEVKALKFLKALNGDAIAGLLHALGITKLTAFSPLPIGDELGDAFHLIPTGPADAFVIAFEASHDSRFCLLRPHQDGVMLRENPRLTSSAFGTLKTPYYAVPSTVAVDNSDTLWFGFVLPTDQGGRVGWVRSNVVNVTDGCHTLFTDYGFERYLEPRPLGGELAGVIPLSGCELNTIGRTVLLHQSPGGSVLVNENGHWKSITGRSHVLAVERTASWFKVDYSGDIGWIKKSETELADFSRAGEQACDPQKYGPVPEVDTTDVTIPSEGQSLPDCMVEITASDGLWLRTQPSTAAPRLTNSNGEAIAARNGNVLTALGVSGGWYLVDLHGVRGWINGSWAQPSKGYCGEEPSTEEEKPDVTERPQPIHPVGLRTQTLSDCKVTTKTIMNFRDAPDGNVIRRTLLIPRDTTFTALERSSDWYKIQYSGIMGWISALPQYVYAEGFCGSS